MPRYPDVLIDPSSERKILDFRPLGFVTVPLLGRYQYASAHQALPIHVHESMMEICYLAQGQQTYDLQGKSYTLRGGDAFITLPNEEHGTGENPEGKGILYWMQIWLPKAERRILGLSRSESHKLRCELLAIQPRHFKAGRALHRDLETIFKVYTDTNNPLRVIEVRNRVLQFLLHIIAVARQKNATSVSPTMQQITEFIRQNLEQPLSLETLAEMACLSLSRFKMRFKQELGVPPADFIARQKILLAQKLLLQPRVTITEIAMRLGYNSSQYFATVFKRYTGQSPSEFRAK